MKTIFKSSWFTLPATIAIALLAMEPARAATTFVTYTIENATTTSPGSGFFEVDLTAEGGTIDLDSFNFGISMPNVNFTITAANCTTPTHTYLFSTDSLFCPTLNGNTLPDTTLNAGDTCNVCATGGTSVGNGVTFGIAEVFFSVAAGVTPGPYTVSFITADDSADSGGNAVTVVDTSTGTITVNAASTPEPSTMALLGVALLPLVWLKKRARS